MPAGEGDQLLLPVRADSDDHQGADPVGIQADGEVHPVHPHIDIVRPGQVPRGEPPPLVPPGRGQPVITDADNPAFEPKNSSSAGTKSLLAKPSSVCWVFPSPR